MSIRTKGTNQRLQVVRSTTRSFVRNQHKREGRTRIKILLETNLRAAEVLRAKIEKTK